jgi:hypothetical protein
MTSMQLATSRASSVILILDCCFTGGATARVLSDIPKLYKEKGVAKKLQRQAKFDLDVDAANELYEQIVEVYNDFCDLIEESEDVFEIVRL